MEQQLTNPERFMVPDVALIVRRDMHIVQQNLAVLYTCVALAQVSLAGSDRLDLGAGQRDAGLNRAQDLVFVVSPAVRRKGSLDRSLVPVRRCLAIGRSAGGGDTFLWHRTTPLSRPESDGRRRRAAHRRRGSPRTRSSPWVAAPPSGP